MDNEHGLQTVRGRQVGPLPIARLNFRERVATSLWFVPGLFVLGAFVASKGLIRLDEARAIRGQSDFLVKVDSAAGAALTATVATAMLTFIAVVFSTTLVAVQVAASQYSPRIVRLFVRSRVTHVTLGVFLATFVFALNALIEIHANDQDTVPAFTIGAVYLLVLATLGMFITFVHAMVRMLRVQYLLKAVTESARPVVERDFPPAASYRTAARPSPTPVLLLRNTEDAVGVVQSMDLHALVRLAVAHGCWIEVLVAVGEYVGVGTPIAEVHGPAAPSISPADITAHFLIGGERTLIQDPGFGLRQLVDTGIRALSPAVNDPTTGVQVIDRVVDLLSGVATAPDPTGWYLDSSGEARVHRPESTFADLIRLGFTELIRYGSDAPQVTRRLFAAFAVLGDLVSPERVFLVDELRGQLDAALADAMPVAFRSVASQPDRSGLG